MSNLSQSQNIFGFKSENDASLVGSSSIKKFGLNQGVYIKKSEYIDKSKEGSPVIPRVQVTFEFSDGSTMFQNYFGINSVWNKGAVITESDPAYQELFARRVGQLSATFSHFMTKIATEEEIIAKQAAFGVNSMESMLKFAAGAIQAVADKRVPLDVFLQYQREIPSGKDRTFLEVPGFLYEGKFLTESTAGTEWTEVRDHQGLRYVNAAGKQHPFTRSAKFMEGVHAKAQGNTNGTPANTEQKINMNSSSAALFNDTTNSDVV